MMAESFDIDCVVIGAGVVGLACARALARAGRETVLVESENAFGTQTSSRNSEVIHAGLYYAEGSLKARFCVAGRRALYDYLAARGIAHRPCGKLVVATSGAEAAQLAGLKARAERNGVEGLELMDGDEARAMEPALSPSVEAALHSLVSGIFDSHGYMLALLGDFEAAGGRLALGAPVLSGQAEGGRIGLHTGGAMPAMLRARTVINCAGHHGVDVAGRIEGPHRAGLPVMRFVKGSYFSVSGRAPFSRLIYPMPGPASLGLHLTVDLSGRGRLGPDAEWLPDTEGPPFDYRVDPVRASVFLEAARQYWPDLRADRLSPDYAGVRPKLVGPGEPSGDFRIEGPGEHGTPGLVNLFGIESPGLTSSLAIAGHVAEIAP
jgi:L-2-hydroxyglutarate oxidase LhgO